MFKPHEYVWLSSKNLETYIGPEYATSIKLKEIIQTLLILFYIPSHWAQSKTQTPSDYLQLLFLLSKPMVFLKDT